jgi:hypothetical protein
VSRRNRKAAIGLAAAVVALLVSAGGPAADAQGHVRAQRPTVAQLLDRLEAQTRALERGSDLTLASEAFTRQLAALFERVDRASRRDQQRTARSFVRNVARAERVADELRANPMLPGGSVYETIDQIYVALEHELTTATQSHLHALARVQRWADIADHAEPTLAMRAMERAAVWQAAVEDTLEEVVEYEAALADTQQVRAMLA